MSIFSRLFGNENRDNKEQDTTPQVQKFIPPYIKKPEKTRQDGTRGFNLNEFQSYYLTSWGNPSVNIDSILKHKLSSVRASCRDLFRSDAYAKGFIQSTVNNVLGHQGITLDAVASYSDGTPDEFLAKILENAFKKWGKYAVNVDIKHKNNWQEIQQTILYTFLRDGEVFIRHIYGQEAGEWGYSIEVIDPEFCDVGLNSITKDGNEVLMGVELDKWRRPVAYYFRTSKDTKNATIFGDSHYVRIPAKDIIHLFNSEYPEQTRGIPVFAATMNRMEMLTNYEDAALTNANYGASIMGYWQPKDGEQNPIEYSSFQTDQGQYVSEVSPGEILLPPMGSQFNPINTSYPDNELPEFAKHMLRSIAAGLGIPSFLLAQDYSEVNFSSARMGNLEARQVWVSLQNLLISKAVVPIYERWLMSALLRGKIVIANRVVGLDEFDRCNDVEFRGRRWSYVDPAKEANANATLIALGVKAPSTVASELGIDFETEVVKIARDKKLMEQAGINQEQQKALVEGIVNNTITPTVDDDWDV